MSLIFHAFDLIEASVSSRRSTSFPSVINRWRQVAVVLIALFCATGQAQSLGSLIASAFQVHPAIQSQQIQTQAAKAGVDAAAWQYYPTLSFSVEQAASGNTGVSSQSSQRLGTVRLQQPLWTGGRLTAGSDKATSQLASNTAQLDETRQQLALQVVQAYGEWLAGHLKTLAQKKSQDTHTRLMDQVKRRISQGLSGDSDMTLAQGRQSLVVADLAQAQAQQAIAISRLVQLTGRSLDPAALQAQLSAPRVVSLQVQPLVDAALTINPGIRKAEAQAGILLATTAERKADLSPEVYVRAERQYGSQTPGIATPIDRIYIGLASRFGAGLSSLAEVNAASLRHQAALADIDAQKILVSAQVLADHALAVSSAQRQIALDLSLAASGQVADSYDRQFLAARKTWLDVMNAARETAQSEVQVADNRSALLIASWRLALYTEPLSNLVEAVP